MQFAVISFDRYHTLADQHLGRWSGYQLDIPMDELVGKIVNRIVVPPPEAAPARVALERMLAAS